MCVGNKLHKEDKRYVLNFVTGKRRCLSYKLWSNKTHWQSDVIAFKASSVTQGSFQRQWGASLANAKLSTATYANANIKSWSSRWRLPLHFIVLYKCIASFCFTDFLLEISKWNTAQFVLSHYSRSISILLGNSSKIRGNVLRCIIYMTPIFA